MSTAPHAPVYEALTLVEVLEAGVIFSHECDLCSAKCWRTSSVLLGVPSAEQNSQGFSPVVLSVLVPVSRSWLTQMSP